MPGKKSPVSATPDSLEIILTVAGKELPGFYNILQIDIRKDLNRIPRALLTIEDGSVEKATFPLSETALLIPGKEVEVKAGYGSSKISIFKGVIVGHGVKIGSTGLAKLLIKCKDKAAALTVGRKNRSFDNKTDADAIKTICSANKVQATVETTKTTHVKLMQYNSTDWDFILSRAEANGMVINIEAGKLDIKAPVTSGTAPVTILYGESLIDCDLSIEAEQQISTMEANTWDIKGQKLLSVKSKAPKENKQSNITGSSLANVFGVKEIQLHSAAPLLQTDLQAWADANVQRARLSRIKGTITFPGSDKVVPGGLLDLQGLGARLNGTAYVSGVRHLFIENTWVTTATIGLNPEWAHETAAVPMQAPATGGILPSGVQGLQVGTVKQIEKDKDGNFRVLVNVPLMEAKGTGVWARLAQVYASKQVGFFFMPEIGDEVILGFFNDDPRHPVILGSMYSSKLAAPYTPAAANPIKAIVTKSKMKIEFNETDKIITILTPGNNSIVIDDKSKAITLKDSNMNTIVMDNAGIKLSSKKDIVLDAMGKVSISGKMGVEAKADAGDVKLDGLNVNATAKIAFAGKGTQAELNGAAMTTIKGGMVMIN